MLLADSAVTGSFAGSKKRRLRRFAGNGANVMVTLRPVILGSELWDLPNVVITPHRAGQTPYYAERVGKLFGKNLQALLDNGSWVNQVV